MEPVIWAMEGTTTGANCPAKHVATSKSILDRRYLRSRRWQIVGDNPWPRLPLLPVPKSSVPGKDPYRSWHRSIDAANSTLGRSQFFSGSDHRWAKFGWGFCQSMTATAETSTSRTVVLRVRLVSQHERRLGEFGSSAHGGGCRGGGS